MGSAPISGVGVRLVVMVLWSLVGFLFVECSPTVLGSPPVVRSLLSFHKVVISNCLYVWRVSSGDRENSHHQPGPVDATSLSSQHSEAEAGGPEFKASLGYKARPRFWETDSNNKINVNEFRGSRWKLAPASS